MRRAAVAVAVLALVAAGCGGGSNGSTRITSDTLTIYTGLPLRGERGDEGRAVLRGEKLALDEVGGRVGGLDIGLTALDDTRTSTGRWDPSQTADNARQAAENPTTIAYIGDLDSGATAVSLPLTNEIGILQVSPLSGYTGLTRPADTGEPAKYYPAGRQTFGRLVPRGALEARALSGWLRRLGIGRATIVSDGEQEGLGDGTELERALQAAGVEVVDVLHVPAHDVPPDVEDVARDVAADPAPAVIYAGGSTRTGAALLRAVHAHSPAEELFATSGMDGPALVRQLGPGAADRLRMTSPLLPTAFAPPAARRFAARYRATFGSAPPPAARYGYEAMRSVLAAIRAAGKNANDRRAVLAAWQALPRPGTVLGTYTIDDRGDTSADAIGAYAVRAGRLRVVNVLHPAMG